jgi:hypothetical protein
MHLTLSKADIKSFINNYHGNMFFLAALERASSSSIALIELLAQYIQWNAVFGAGVVNLAGAIAHKQDMFRDDAEPIALISDRSCDVASSIFFAAIDEFGPKKNHRSMAQDTLRESASLLNISHNNIATLSRPSTGTSAAISAVVDSYCLNKTASDADLLLGIGFHIGSEVFADQEFNILDQYLRQRHQVLVTGLQSRKAYRWIAVHTKAEADHFDAAVGSANLALKFYTGNQAQAHSCILDGLNHFGNVQAQFMNSLVDL